MLETSGRLRCRLSKGCAWVYIPFTSTGPAYISTSITEHSEKCTQQDDVCIREWDISANIKNVAVRPLVANGQRAAASVWIVVHVSRCATIHLQSGYKVLVLLAGSVAMPGFFKRFHRDKARANTEKQSGQQSATGQEARPLSAGLFHRRSHKVRPAADSNGAPVESSIVLAVAPSLDIRFPLERTPSPTLVQVDESQSPWVDVGEVSAGQHVAGTSLGLAGLSWQQRPVNPRLKAILARARLNAHQTTTLIIACARVLGEQGRSGMLLPSRRLKSAFSGLSTLGLFRPWRIAESPFLITHTLGLFLQAVDPDGAAIPLADKDLLAIGRDEKATQLGLFEATLADIGPHNVAACMKWVSCMLNSVCAGMKLKCACTGS